MHPQTKEEMIEKYIQKHKEQARIIADYWEYDPTNMTRHVENPYVRNLVFQHIDSVRELDDILQLLK